jgi:hypothetical protein
MSVSRFCFGLLIMSLCLGAGGCRRVTLSPIAKPTEGKTGSPVTAPATSPVTPPATTAKTDKPPGSEKDKAKAEDGEAPEPPKSWSDPRVLAELVKSCAFEPDSLPEADRQKWLGVQDEGNADSPLSCSASMEQSCVYDPCHDEQSSKCNPRCESKCRSCGKSCAARCETCKTPCQDDACRMACASKCASCRESCVRRRDRCATGTCTEEYKKCRVKLRDEWEANGCAEICKTIEDCKSACEEKNQKAKRQKDCDKACPAPKGGGKCDMNLCSGEGGMGIDPSSVD